MEGRQFPILSSSRSKRPDLPASVPWSVVAPHAERALKNHSQSLERLAERGGLSPLELRCVVEDLKFRWWAGTPEVAEASRAAEDWLIELVAFLAAPPAPASLDALIDAIPGASGWWSAANRREYLHLAQSLVNLGVPAAGAVQALGRAYHAAAREFGN